MKKHTHEASGPTGILSASYCGEELIVRRALLGAANPKPGDGWRRESFPTEGLIGVHTIRVHNNDSKGIISKYLNRGSMLFGPFMWSRNPFDDPTNVGIRPVFGEGEPSSDDPARHSVVQLVIR